MVWKCPMCGHTDPVQPKVCPSCGYDERYATLICPAKNISFSSEKSQKWEDPCSQKKQEEQKFDECQFKERQEEIRRWTEQQEKQKRRESQLQEQREERKLRKKVRLRTHWRPDRFAETLKIHQPVIILNRKRR